MTEQSHIKVLLSPRTNTLLRVGLGAEYTRRLVEDYIKEESVFDLSDDRLRSMSPAKRKEYKERIARSNAEGWLKTGVGKEAVRRCLCVVDTSRVGTGRPGVSHTQNLTEPGEKYPSCDRWGWR